MRRTISVALVFLVLSMGPAISAGLAPFDEGVAAYRQEDYATALRLWRPLAEQGHAVAQYHIGFMYERGLGVAQSYADAEKWYRKVVGQSDDAVRSAHWSSSSDGRGMSRDQAKETRWWRRLAEQESHLSKEDFGAASEVSKEPAARERAEPVVNAADDPKHCLEAAERGDANCQYLVGLMYYEGVGALQDFIKAHMWLNLSASRGDRRAIRLRGDLTRAMTPTEIAEAQRLARDWVSK